MPKPSASKLPAAVAAALLATATAIAAPSSMRFDKTFSSTQPVSLHYEARYAAASGAQETLQVWRDRDSRIKRRTGNAIETYAVRAALDDQYELTVLDLHRKLLTRISRTNLSRLGNFTDWFDLSHALRHPKGSYTLLAGKPPAGADSPVAPCTWYDLEQQGRTAHICWNARVQLPMQIVQESGRTVWRVTRLDVGPIAAGVFRVDAREFVHVDANQDMERD